MGDPDGKDQMAEGGRGMNTQLQNIRQKLRPDRLLRRFWTMLSHNWPWKLLALLLALCLWAGLITQDTSLTRERVFYDVPVSVAGEDTLRRANGLIVVSGLEDDNLTARMRVEVPQGEYNTVTAANYNPRIDLSRVTSAGEQTLKISVTNTSAYGTVTSVSPDSVTIEVDEYVTNYRVPVTVNLSGDYPEGYYGVAPTASPSTVTISGPKTVVDRIVRVVVDYDVSQLAAQEGKARTALPLRFVDLKGDTVESDLLEVSSANVLLRSVVVEQTLYPIQTVELSGTALTQGTPADGYHIASVQVSPASITAAGDGQALSGIEQLYLENPVDVTGATESFTVSIKVKKPSEITYLSADTVTVAVNIEPVEISRTFDNVKLFAKGITDGLSASLSQKTLNVVLTGPQLTLNNLRAANVTAYVDVTDLEEGEYLLPVRVRIENGSMDGITYIATPAGVQVTLSK